MEKRVIRKEDGRYLIFYGFDRPLPQVTGESAAQEAAGGGRTGPETHGARPEAAATPGDVAGSSPADLAKGGDA